MRDSEIMDVRDDELVDSSEAPGWDVTRVDWSVVQNPVVLRAIAGICLSAAILLWPERSDRILARLVGIGLILGASSMARAAWSGEERGLRRTFYLGLSGGVFVLGAALLVSPTGSQVMLGRLVAAAIGAVALRNLAGLLMDRVDLRESRRWILTRSTAQLSFAVVLLAFPNEILGAATTIAAVSWIVVSVVVVVAAVDTQHSGIPSFADTWWILARFLEDRPKSIDDRRTLYDKILYEPPHTTSRVIRFFALMGFASVIASMGVITNSTAVVIGAMLIAPLMMPLMGMAISLVMGWPRRLARSAIIAGGGIIFAIGIGVICGLLVPTIIDTETNSQIVSRASPTTLDLIVALAAGAAGAYGLSRPDVSDSLPGVAIAISLVPPLTVVGIAYSQGDWSSGNGALLLFSTNMIAILVMGGATFIATGVTPIRQVAENQHRVRTAAATVITVGVLVVGALLLNGAQIASNLIEESAIDDGLEAWIADYPNHQVVQVGQRDEVINVVIVGPADGAPQAESLADALSQALDRGVTADLRLIVEERTVASVDR